MRELTEALPDNGETLAARLDRGPVPFPEGVRYAYEIARSLRQLHRGGRPHGAVSGENIELRSTGVTLLPPAEILMAAQSPQHDIRSFGFLLQSLFAGEPPAERAADSVVSGAWSTVKEVAQHCLSDPPDWSMQRVVSELCLAFMVVRQWENSMGVRALPGGQARGLAPPALALPMPAQPIAAAKSAPSKPELKFATPPMTPKMASMRCPRCAAMEVYPSSPRSDFEATLWLFHIPLMGCRRCSYRYLKLLKITIPRGSEN